MTTAVQIEGAVDRPVLDELVAWVKTLTAAGVSPDKAAEVSRDFLLMACADHEQEYEEYDEEDQE